MSEEIISSVLEIFQKLANVTSDFILGDSSFAVILRLFSHEKENIRISALKLVTTMMEYSEAITLMIESKDFDFLSNIRNIYFYSGSDEVKKQKKFERI